MTRRLLADRGDDTTREGANSTGHLKAGLVCRSGIKRLGPWDPQREQSRYDWLLKLSSAPTKQIVRREFPPTQTYSPACQSDQTSQKNLLCLTSANHLPAQGLVSGVKLLYPRALQYDLVAYCLS